MKLKKLLETGIILTALSTPINLDSQTYSCEAPKNSAKISTIQDNPTYTDFRKALGRKRFRSISGGEKELRSYWSSLNNKEKEMITNTYQCPKQVYENLSKKEKTEFKKDYDFSRRDIRTLKPKEIRFLNKSHKDRFPWKINIRRFKLSDRLWDYLESSDLKEDVKIPKIIIKK